MSKTLFYLTYDDGSVNYASQGEATKSQDIYLQSIAIALAAFVEGKSDARSHTQRRNLVNKCRLEFDGDWPIGITSCMATAPEQKHAFALQTALDVARQLTKGALAVPIEQWDEVFPLCECSTEACSAHAAANAAT